MPSTLICLTSEQRMQNAIPLFHKECHFDRVFLIVSSENDKMNARFERNARDFIAAFSDRTACDIHLIPVDPMDPANTRAELEALASSFGQNSQITINFTGGTKPMSIGAYQAGVSLDCQMMYVDTQKEQIYLYDGGIPRIVPFDLEPIRVVQILRAHGKSIQNVNLPSAVIPPEPDVDLSEQISANAPLSFSILNSLHLALNEILKIEQEQNKQQKELVNAQSITSKAIKTKKEYMLPAEDFDSAPWLAEAFLQAGVVRPEGNCFYLNNEAFRYINGTWLEKFVFYRLEQSQRFHDLMSNVKITDIENEIDIACTLNAKLAIVECKSGLVNGKAGQPILNRLRALKESLAGAFGKAFLISTTSNSLITPQFQARAKEYVSRIIGLEDLMDADQIIYDEMTRRNR